MALPWNISGTAVTELKMFPVLNVTVMLTSFEKVARMDCSVRRSKKTLSELSLVSLTFGMVSVMSSELRSSLS